MSQSIYAVLGRTRSTNCRSESGGWRRGAKTSTAVVALICTLHTARGKPDIREDTPSSIFITKATKNHISNLPRIYVLGSHAVSWATIVRMRSRVECNSRNTRRRVNVIRPTGDEGAFAVSIESNYLAHVHVVQNNSVSRAPQVNYPRHNILHGEIKRLRRRGIRGQNFFPPGVRDRKTQ